MKKLMGIYEITLLPEIGAVEFEEFVKTKIFPKIRMTPTRAGQVISQYLIIGEVSARNEQKYCYIVQWTEEGGTHFDLDLFGGRKQLEEFSADISLTVFGVVADQFAESP